MPEARPALRKRADKFIASEVDGEVILIHGDSGQFFALANVGLAVWQLLDFNQDLSAICRELDRRYEIEPAECRKAVQEFANQLVDAGFAEFA